MWKTNVTPRFGDADGLGHINNTVIAIWFELARNPVWRIFDPDMDLSHGVWPLILAHTDFDFVSQMYLKSDVEIRTIISKIGTKSFTVSHEAYQDGRLCVKGNAVLVCYDFINQKSKELPDNIKIELEKGGRTFDTPSTSQELNIESV